MAVRAHDHESVRGCSPENCRSAFALVMLERCTGAQLGLMLFGTLLNLLSTLLITFHSQDRQWQLQCVCDHDSHLQRNGTHVFAAVGDEHFLRRPEFERGEQHGLVGTADDQFRV